jgi:tRNA threonylcarbamoyladenosine biosynthesis protein TsaB
LKILAIELATSRAGVAVLADEQVTAERTWVEEGIRNQGLFAALAELAPGPASGGTDFDAVAVDVGPGSFNGIRIALAAAEGLAMPRGRRVIGVSSAEAIAADVLAETQAERVVVFGDARRGRLWRAAFSAQGGAAQPVGTFDLVAESEIGQGLGPADTVATPDWDRIGDSLQRWVPREARLLPQPRFPRSATLARLARRRASDPGPTPRPLPIYLHPPVALPPRDARGDGMTAPERPLSSEGGTA